MMKRKKFAAAGLAFLMSVTLLTGCRCARAVEDETESMTVTEAATERVTEKETETEEADTGFRNPLTGEVTETDISKNRPYFVMLNTVYDALPQRGNSKADILIEMMEEGGITRVVGVYQDITGVGELGSIRSTREYFYSWVKAFDGIDVHAGGDYWVLEKIKGEGYSTLDALETAGGAFYRDAERQKTVSNEHTMFTTSDKLQSMTEQLGLRTTIDEDADLTVLSFIQDGTPKKGETATYVKVTFSGYKKTEFAYDKKTGLYEVSCFDEPYVDEAADLAQVAVTNVLVLPVPNWTALDGWSINRQKYDLSGGTGYYFCGGKAEEITWTKGDYNDEEEYANPLKLYHEDGTELSLGVGKTYICVINNTMNVEFE